MQESQQILQERHNQPQKIAPEKHIALLIGSIYLAVSVIFSTYTQSLLAMLLIAGQGYLVYFVIARWLDSTWNYLADMQPIEAYDSIYQSLQRNTGHFEFKVSCYHYESSTTYHNRARSDGSNAVESSTTTNKTVTHSNTQTLAVRECIDDSGRITSLDQGKALVFMEYQIETEHSSAQSEQDFREKFEQFKRDNDRDQFQDASWSFVVPGFKEKIGFKLRRLPEMEKYRKWVLTGLAYLLARQIEKHVARYKVTLKKKITV